MQSHRSESSSEIELDELAGLINSNDTVITIYEDNFFERNDAHGNMITNDIFNELSSWLPYIQDLSNLSQTSKKLQEMVAKTDSGKLANAFYQEAPYLNSFWANPVTYTVVTTFCGIGLGALSGITGSEIMTFIGAAGLTRLCTRIPSTASIYPTCKDFSETSNTLIFGSASAVGAVMGGSSGGALAFRYASQNSAQKAYQYVGLFKQSHREYLQDLAEKRVLLSQPYSASRI